MLPSTFLRRLPEAVRPHLPPAAETLHMQPRGHLLKIWYGADGSIHYEVWVHERTQQLELGLHCEAEPARNERIRRQLGFYLFDIKAALGNAVELEVWDRGWARLYETHPLYPLDEPRLNELAGRIGLFIRTVQPIYAEIRQALAAGK
ncbi:MAG TPA: hypothetical protein VKY74_20840 [Chloroflexia bacterium]|nr:hypothetical protein [Chloroflexia bacterium]